ncbi:MAG: class I SAM-dependent methyltransferase [Thermoflexales bacterium]
MDETRRDSVGAQTGLLYDLEGRQRKAEKIRAALARVASDTRTLSLLDVGCASGIITRALAADFRFTAGIDLNETGLRMPPGGTTRQLREAHFLQATTARLPFADCCFDVVVCAQVYEHVADQAALSDEIFRVLKPGGWMFFSGPNRTWPIEDHYKLFGLGWLPQKWASAYLRLAKRGRVFDENLLTSWQLENLFKRFVITDVTPLMIKSPADFKLDIGIAGSLAAILPNGFLSRLSWIYPNPNWLLFKPVTNTVD